MPPRRAAILVESNGNELLSSANDVVIGSRTGCDVVVADAVVADRHCSVSCDDGFTVRDLDSVTGTWVDGAPARPTAAIGQGSEIVIGTSRLTARIEDRDGVSTLVLDLQQQAFWWKRPGKGVFDNDPDAMVRTEVDFGRFRALQTGNRVAAWAALALLVAGVCFGFVREPLVDAGPLLPEHATVAAIAAGAPDVSGNFAAFAQRRAEQGCNVCHSTGGGTPASKCLQCHTDLAEPSTWRHPYLGDGVISARPRLHGDAESFCSLCHRDHQGKDFLAKQTSDRLLGKCELCHTDSQTPFDDAARKALIAELTSKSPVPPQVKRQKTFATYVFPHGAHLEKGIECKVCHEIDPEVKARMDAGTGDDPGRDDFAETPFETCKKCHVPSRETGNLTAAEREKQQLPAKEHQWPVSWHGTDEGGKFCQQCHAQATRERRTVFGPEMRTVERPKFTPAQYAAEGALYIAKSRSHRKQFDDHSQQQACTTCHLRNGVAASDVPPTRTFWHALHTADGSLAPPAGQRAAVSQDDKQGCVSCHGDLATATTLRTADQGGYRWPAEAERQIACKPCHIEGDAQIVLQPAGGPLPPDRRAMAPAFPHDVHVGSRSYGVANTPLENGCFACHSFETPAGEAAFRSVPVTNPKAADCTQCHAGHDNIGGGSCRRCHPAEKDRSNSFLLSALVPAGTQVGGRAVPAAPQRAWPTRNPFSHLSRGHAAEPCSRCHRDTGLEAAKTLDAFAIPDEATAACRACHLERQFHWR
ncbi:MAG TPA: cytochrome c3 family protein [Planctomycetota bacterium]|nr:cytochrome c3 family protein [Planctomycetota bacterium]